MAAPSLVPGAIGGWGVAIELGGAAVGSGRPDGLPARLAAQVDGNLLGGESAGESAAGLSPELRGLLNAAVINPAFRAALLAAPAAAASDAALAPQVAFGCRLPDPGLRLPPIYLPAADQALLRTVPRARTLAELCRHLMALAAERRSEAPAWSGEPNATPTAALAPSFTGACP